MYENIGVLAQFAVRMRADNLADRGARVEFSEVPSFLIFKGGKEEEAEKIGGGEVWW